MTETTTDPMVDAYKTWLDETNKTDNTTNQAAFAAGWEAAMKMPVETAAEVPPDLDRH